MVTSELEGSREIKPIFDKVVVIRDETPEKIGGIIVPDSVKERDKPLTGKVHAIGPEVRYIKVGDCVVFSQYAGMNIALDDQSYIIMKEEDIHCVLKDKYKEGGLA